jgi:hypothetical protein
MGWVDNYIGDRRDMPFRRRLYSYKYPLISCVPRGNRSCPRSILSSSSPVRPAPEPPPSNVPSSTSLPGKNWSLRSSRAIASIAWAGSSSRRQCRRAEAAGNKHFSHFGPEANDFEALANLFKTYGKTGSGKKRYYIHSDEEAAQLNKRLGTNLKPGEFTPWEDVPKGTDLLFYEGLHGRGEATDKDMDMSPPTETSSHRRGARGQSGVDPEDPPRRAPRAATPPEASPSTRSCGACTPYVNYVICPQFSRTGHQLPARADGRHVQSRSSPADIPTAGRKSWW